MTLIYPSTMVEPSLCPLPSSSRENPSLHSAKMGVLLGWLWNTSQKWRMASFTEYNEEMFWLEPITDSHLKIPEV